MNYAQIRKYDTANGRGIRTSVFFSGCTHNCYGCFNKEYRDFNYGKEFTKDTANEIISYLNNPYVSGLTLLGGEPLQQDLKLLEETLIYIKKNIDTNKTIWLYSGYTYEEIVKNEPMLDVIKQIDILVDGKYMQQYKNLKLKFRGSSNQRIIDIKKSLENKKVFVIDDDSI